MVPRLVKSCRLHTRINQTKKVRFSIWILNDLQNFILKQTLPNVEPKWSLYLASPGMHIGPYAHISTIFKPYLLDFWRVKYPLFVSLFRLTCQISLFYYRTKKNYKKIYYYCGVKFYFSKSKTCMGNWQIKNETS